MNSSLMVEENNVSENLKLQVSRVIKASRQRVFEAWTKPEMIQQWFGPKNRTVLNVSADLRVGGAYRVEMSGACEGGEAASPVAAYGTYQEIVLNELLRFSWHGDWDPSEATMVTVSLRDVEGGTEVNLTHEGFVSAESRDRHQHGWTVCMENLAAFCAR